MIKLKIIFVFFFFICCFKGTSQVQFPDYKTVLERFFKNYDYDLSLTEAFNFAKKKTGWYAEVIGVGRKVVISELLWDPLNPNSYLALKRFDRPINERGKERIKKLLTNDGYYYERLPMYGYHDWPNDVLEYYGLSLPTKDTLIEALALAHLTEADRYWFAPDSAKSQPDQQKSTVEKMIARYEKAIELYKKLSERNPEYATKTGVVSTMLFKVQMTKYMCLSMLGEEEKSRDFIRSIHLSPFLKQTAVNYLNTFPPNSIVVADEFSYLLPILYVQQTEKYRSDVTFVNYTVLRSALYLNWLKTKFNLSFSTDPYLIGSIYVLFNKNKELFSSYSIFLKDLIAMVQNKECKTQQEDGRLILCYDGDIINFPIDEEAFKKNYSDAKFSKSIKFGLGKFLKVEDFMVFDMIQSNFNKRPFYFTNINSQFEGSNTEGLGSYRLIPFPYDFSYKNEKIEAYLQSKYKRVTGTESLFQYMYKNSEIDLVTRLYHKVIQGYLSTNSNAKAKFWSQKYLNIFKNEQIPYSRYLKDMSVSLMRSGLNKEGIQLLETMGKYVLTFYKSGNSLSPYLTYQTAIDELEKCLGTLVDRKLDSKKLREYIQELELSK